MSAHPAGAHPVRASHLVPSSGRPIRTFSLVRAPMLGPDRAEALEAVLPQTGQVAYAIEGRLFVRLAARLPSAPSYLCPVSPADFLAFLAGGRGGGVVAEDLADTFAGTPFAALRPARGHAWRRDDGVPPGRAHRAGTTQSGREEETARLQAWLDRELRIGDDGVFLRIPVHAFVQGGRAFLSARRSATDLGLYGPPSIASRAHAAAEVLREAGLEADAGRAAAITIHPLADLADPFDDIRHAANAFPGALLRAAADRLPDWASAALRPHVRRGELGLVDLDGAESCLSAVAQALRLLPGEDDGMLAMIEGEYLPRLRPAIPEPDVESISRLAP